MYNNILNYVNVLSKSRNAFAKIRRKHTIYVKWIFYKCFIFTISLPSFI